MPTWMHAVLDVVLSWWPLAVVGVVLVPAALAKGLTEPVRRAPWAGAPWWRVTIVVLVALVWGGDAFFGTDPGLAERLAKGSLVLAGTIDVGLRTVRWLRAGRPDEADPLRPGARGTGPRPWTAHPGRLRSLPAPGAGPRRSTSSASAPPQWVRSPRCRRCAAR